MRRLVLSVIMATGLVMIGAGSASAEPAPAAGESKADPGKKVCKVESSLLNELSGMVATTKGYVVINDSTDSASRKKVFFLDGDCAITKSRAYSGAGPRDTEDLALSKDGKTLWVADIGDNNKERPTIGLWKLAVDGTKSPTLYRMAYPEGDGPYDAEALLLNGDGTPIIVTKSLTDAFVYVPTAPLKANSEAGVPMKRAGKITVPPSTTPTPVLTFARTAITGGAVAPDGAKVALRTYTDALEWDVKDGDVVAALTGTPRVTPLPDELQGESIAYTSDGKSFLTVTDMSGKAADTENPNFILRYTPSTKTATLTAGAGTTKSAASGQSFFDKLTIQDITYLVGAIGVLGAILVGLGVWGILRARKRPPVVKKGTGSAPPLGERTAPAFAPPGRENHDLARARPVGAGQGPPSRSGVYGGSGRPAVAPAAGPGVYGAPAAPAAPKKGGVYGGAPATGGRPGGGGPPSSRPTGGGVYGAPPPAPPVRQQGPHPGRPQGQPGNPPPGHPGYGRDHRDYQGR